MPNDYSAILVPKEFHVAHTWKRDIAYDQLFSLCGELREGLGLVRDKTIRTNGRLTNEELHRIDRLLAAYPLTKGAGE